MTFINPGVIMGIAIWCIPGIVLGYIDGEKRSREIEEEIESILDGTKFSVK